MPQQPYTSQEGFSEEGVEQEGAGDTTTPSPPPDTTPAIRKIMLVQLVFDAPRIIARKGI